MLRALVALFALGCGGGSKPASTPPPAAGEDKTELAEIQVKRLAFEDFPSWVVNNPDKQCPATVDELAPGATKDPWGTEVRMFCGATLPAGATGLAIQSAGPDLTLDTADDVKSW